MRLPEYFFVFYMMLPSVNPRILMRLLILMFLVGAANIYCQDSAPDVYISELVVRSNATLEASTVIALLNATNFQVTDSTEVFHTVAIEEIALVAECLIIGKTYSCNCSKGYIWSNEVCNTHQCCGETTCSKNLDGITLVCVAKAEVRISGSVTLKNDIQYIQEDTLRDAFKDLNGFRSLNVTGFRLDRKIIDFEAEVSVKFSTLQLQTIMTQLESSLGASITINTAGMVTIKAPNTRVCYQSSPVLKCLFEEATDSAKWTMSNRTNSFELNNGSVVRLNNSCATNQYRSCTEVTLRMVRGIWEGTYECAFTIGSVVHRAKADLKVALLPDMVTLKTIPMTVDCFLNTPTVDVNVTATILYSTEAFYVWGSYMGEWISNLTYKPDGDQLLYTFTVPVSCKKTPNAQYVHVTFENNLKQRTSARLDIPVIYVGERFCSEEMKNGEFWPKTPAGNTVINRTCPYGRVGYKSRTCEDVTWQEVFSRCTNEELGKVANAANNFLMGLGATQEMALDIFYGIWNNTVGNNSDSSDTIADISTSISILNMMSRASENVYLQEDVFPNFVNASSSMLSRDWVGINESTLHDMSASYLQAVEGLVKNIKVNKSDRFSSPNLELKFCSRSDCTLSVFDINVNLNKSDGILKTVAVKNLTDKLNNNFGDTVHTSLVISATLENNSHSSLQIKLDFPNKQLRGKTPFCVFWNTANGDWSDVGCTVKNSSLQRTQCECIHLTSFSVLMAKRKISDSTLDLISNVGLAVSICALITFLIIERVVWSTVAKTNLSHFRHTAVVNIATFRLLADCSFLASSFPKALSNNWCLFLTICKHLFYLAMFSWMLCMSVMLIHQIIFVFTPLRKRVFMFFSSIIGYICPILIVGCSYVHSKYTEKPYFDAGVCWLVYEKLLEGSIHAFLIPIGTIIFINLFSMMVVIITLTKTSVPDNSKTHDKDTAKSVLKVVVILTPVFGITWIFGFAQLLLEEGTVLTVVYYSFTIMNSFQGLFILLTGCFTEQKVREELMKLLKLKLDGKRETTNNTTSVTLTSYKDK